MATNKFNKVFYGLAALIVCALVFYWFIHYKSSESEKTKNLAQLTSPALVIDYLSEKGTLPEIYVTKDIARAAHWQKEKGNLQEVLPGKAIGGDIYHNYEKHLEPNYKWFEADLNYKGGYRNADRLFFSCECLLGCHRSHNRNCLMYTTSDHMESTDNLKKVYEKTKIKLR